MEIRGKNESTPQKVIMPTKYFQNFASQPFSIEGGRFLVGRFLSPAGGSRPFFDIACLFTWRVDEIKQFPYFPNPIREAGSNGRSYAK